MGSLQAALRSARLAGDVGTPRESNLAHARRFAAGDSSYAFGLAPRRDWSFEEVVRLLADRVGIDPDPTRCTGSDTIDPTRTCEALERMRQTLARAAGCRASVLLATGHPIGMIEVHLAVAAMLRARGARILTPGAGVWFEVGPSESDGPARQQLRYIGGVAVSTDGRSAWHSHSPAGMNAALASLAAGQAPPDLVIADHGFAGAAAAAGLPVVCFADANDPALFVGAAEGRVEVVVPIDDNVQPHLYAPVIEYLSQQ